MEALGTNPNSLSTYRLPDLGWIIVPFIFFFYVQMDKKILFIQRDAPSSQGNYVGPDKRPWIWWTKLWCQSNLKLQPGCRFHVTAGQGPNTLFLLQTWTKTPSALFQEANIAWMSRRKTFHFRLPPTLKTTRALTQRGKLSGLIFGHFEKNSNSEKLKTQAKSWKNSDQISKKLKICQLH